MKEQYARTIVKESMANMPWYVKIQFRLSSEYNRSLRAVLHSLENKEYDLRSNKWIPKETK